MMLPLRIELAMTFKAVFLNFWPSANPDMGVHGADRAVSGCNILILPVDASRFPAVRRAVLGRKQPDFTACIGRRRWPCLSFQGHAEARKLSELRWLPKRMDKVRIFRHEMTEFSLTSSPPAAH